MFIVASPFVNEEGEIFAQTPAFFNQGVAECDDISDGNLRVPIFRGADVKPNFLRQFVFEARNCFQNGTV